MKIYTEILKISTKEKLEFISVTDKINEIIKKSNINNGFVNVFSKHTTLAIKINENESLLLKDMNNFLKQIAPDNKEYFHDKIELRKNCPLNELKNADGHLKNLVLETSQIIPIKENQLYLGKWQDIIVIETCGPRKREILIQVIGE